MKAKKIINAAAIAVFVAAQISLYITFMCFNLKYETANAVKYTSVILCTVFALYCCKGKRLSDLCLLGALIFTAFSDWHLLILEDNFELGLSTFIVAQLLHFARIYLLRRKPPYISLLIRVILSAAAVAELAALNSLTLLTALAAVYFCNLLVNFADSLPLIKINKRYALLAVGLLLFICCDICVGIYNFGDALSVSLPKNLIKFADKGMWAFYLPSQTLIVLSGEIK